MLFKQRKTNFPEDKKSLPIIIGGCYRSGTTLLRRILDSHSNIHCPPEVKFFRDLYGNYIHDELKNLRFLATARQMGLETGDLLNIFGKAFIESHALAAKKSGKPRWADKNPENVIYLNEWWQILDGKFLFIMLIRDPLDTLASIREMKFSKTLPSDFKELIELHNEYVAAGLKFIKLNKDQSYLIRYEDLVTDPAAAVKDLTQFIGENFEESMLTSFNSSTKQRGIEDPKIHQSKSIHTASIGRWKTELSEQEIAYISRKCRKFIKKFNYQI